jgi:hypothetical protein
LIQTKAILYDQLVKQSIREIGELLEDARVEFKRYNFEQIGKYTIQAHSSNGKGR